MKNSGHRQKQGGTSRPAWKKRIRREKRVGTFKISMILLLSLTFVPLMIYANDIKGSFTISDFFSSDSDHDIFHILASKLKLYMNEDEKSAVSFKIDGRFRKAIDNEDIHEDIPEFIVSEMWLGYRFPDQKWNIVAGRQYIDELYNTSVDGLSAEYFITKGFKIGVFGGLAPDKYDYSFNTKYRSLGLYASLEQSSYTFDIGYENLSYKGDTDREYVSVKLNSKITDTTRFNILSSVSRNQLTHDLTVENINANIIHDLTKDLRLTVFYDYYRAIRYFESSKQLFDRFDRDYYLDTDPQTRTGVRADYTVSKGLKVYGSAAYQKRDIDDKDAVMLTAGALKNDIFGFDVSGRYTYIDNFTSRSSEFNVEVSRTLFDTVDVSVYASHEKEKLDIENGFTSGLFTYGASAYWFINRHYYASMFVERAQEDDYDNTAVFTQLGYRF